MSSLSTVPDIARAKKMYRATLPLPFANIPAIDLKDRLSVLTLAAGLRSVGVLETWGQRLSVLRDTMIGQGLATSVATCVWSRIERPEDTPHRDILSTLDEQRVAGKPKHVLWLYADAQERDRYRQPSFTQQQAGTLLYYPPCCIAFESTVMAQLPQAKLEALIVEAGNDDARLLALVRRNKPLPAPKLSLPDNALRTEQRFPFALHVACNECLSGADSPSARLNFQYAELARGVDEAFYELFLQIKEMYSEISHNQACNQVLLARIRASHERFFSGKTQS